MLLLVVLSFFLLLFSWAESASLFPLTFQHSLLYLEIDNECAPLKYMQTTATEPATASCLLSYLESDRLHSIMFTCGILDTSSLQQMTHLNCHS